jgi:WS/DGAT/MGAT family acyltransferase
MLSDPGRGGTGSTVVTATGAGRGRNEQMTRRLAGSDAGFLYIESPTNTSTCVDLMVLGPAADGRGPLTVHDLRDHLAARLHLVPSLRWRLAPVPGGLDTPRWVDDPDFDLGYHVRHATLPAPGGDDELRAFVATQLPGLLDQRHPLWQVVLVDGPADGRQALVWRFHHTLADGAGLVTTLGRLFGPPPTRPAPAWNPQIPPGPVRLLAGAVRHQARAWRDGPALLRETLQRFKAVDERRATAPVAVPRSMGDAPRTVLNHSSDARRSFGLARLDLARLQQVRTAAGTTLSDVVLAVVAGALRGHLLDHEALPDRPLVVNVPVANDPPGAPPRITGNVFANYFSFLATDETDPRARLAAIAAANTEAKEQLEVQGRHTLPAWLDRIPPVIAARGSAWMSARQRAGTTEPDFNVLVSNVRIPDPSWSLDGRPVERFAMSGPVADGAGLNVTVVGYDDTVHVALVTNPAAVDRPQDLARRIEEALDELVDACTGPAADAEPVGV